MNASPVTLCVPTYSRYELCADMLLSAAAGTVKPDAYVVIDNGGSFHPVPALTSRLGEALRVVRPGRNLGVAASWNWFLLNVAGHLLVCNDDVRLEPHTLETLLAAKAEQPNGLVFHPDGGSGEANVLSVFLIDPRAADVVGYFDETFHPAYFEDDDYLYRMKRLGLRPLPVPGCGYFHHCSATLRAMPPADAAAHAANFAALRDYYVTKWGGEPGDERFERPFGDAASSAADRAAEDGRVIA